MWNLKSMEPARLEACFQQMGLPKFRARQVFQWMHKGAESFREMTNLPETLRRQLEETCDLEVLKTEKVLVSRKDATRKYLFSLKDGQRIESVFMKYHYGNTACISSQAGCRMGCAFCASHEGGLIRNLTPGEMMDQVLRIRRESGEQISHVVVMGVGEPFDNYENLLHFLRLLHDPMGLNMSYRNMTVSTCGILPGIEAFASDMPQVTLAVSLHAPLDSLRSQIMPINRKYGLEELIKACRNYCDLTNKRITFEYILIDGVNDSPASARQLSELLGGMLCHVNLIPFNGVYGRMFHSASPQVCRKFQKILEEKGIEATIRRELGGDINGACGQLRSTKAENKG